MVRGLSVVERPLIEGGKVQPEDGEIYQFALDAGRYVLERRCMPNVMETLLDNANGPFDTRDVLVS